MLDGKVMETDRDLRLVVMFGLRYCLPRHTYALDYAADCIIRYIKCFSESDIEGMIKDCELYYPFADLGGDICDRPRVDRFKERLESELENRRKNK